MVEVQLNHEPSAPLCPILISDITNIEGEVRLKILRFKILRRIVLA